MATLYGLNSIEGNDLQNRIVRILQRKNMDDIINHIIGRLYVQRCLLRSIFQAEEHDGEYHRTHNRKYDNSFALYLSLRGNKIMDLLAYDSLLLELYRDDIDTTINGNQIPSSKMQQTQKLLYLIEYCTHLFEKEQDYISKADQEQYFRWFGGSFVTFRLLRGINNSYLNYYKREDADAKSVEEAIRTLYEKMVSYKDNLLNKNGNLRINLQLE